MTFCTAVGLKYQIAPISIKMNPISSDCNDISKLYSLQLELCQVIGQSQGQIVKVN